jgi:hypothetical protein
VDASPTVAATKLVFPNGTLGVVGTVATYTPAASATVTLTSRLAYVASSNLHNPLALSAGTWADVVSNQNFTVAGTSSLLLVTVRLACSLVNGNGSVTNVGCAAQIDSAGTPINAPLGGDVLAATSGAGMLNGGSFFLSGLSAGTHTIKIRAKSGGTASLYCRPSGAADYEFAEISIYEVSP